jgi:type I restriction enzyme S subunit
MSDRFFEHAIGTSAGSLSPRTNWSSLANYEFDLPPLDQQRRIAEILNLTHETSNKFSKLASIYQSTINNLFSYAATTAKDGSILSLASHNDSLPAGWTLEPLHQVADIAYGISESVASNRDPSIGWPILTGANITLDGKLNLAKIVYVEAPTKDSFVLKKGDVLFNWRSGSIEHVGKTALFELEGNWTYASFILRIRAGSKVNNQFLQLLMNHMRRRKLFGGATSQQVNFKLNASYLRNMPVLLPPISEQIQIVQSIESHTSCLRKVEATQKTLGRLLSAYLASFS